MPFDPNQPFEVVSSNGFDPNKPFEVIDNKSDLQKRVEQGDPNARFISEEELSASDARAATKEQFGGIGTQVAASTLRATNVLGGLPQKIGNIALGAAEAVGEKVGLIETKPEEKAQSLFTRFKENYKEATQLTDEFLQRSAEARPVVAGLAEGAKYYLDPLGKIVRGAKLVKGASSILGTSLAAGAEVGTVEGQKALVDSLDRVAQGEDVSKVALSESGKLLFGTAIAATTAGTLKFAASPISSVGRGLAAGGQRIAKRARARLGPEAQKILDNLKDATRIGNKQKARLAVVENNKELANNYLKAKQTMQEALANSADDAKPLLEDFIQEQTAVLDVQAKDLVEQLAKKSPQGVEENLRRTAAVMDRFDKTVQHNYGRELDAISDQVIKDVDISGAVDNFRNALSSSNDLIIDKAGKVIAGDSSKPAVAQAVNILNDILQSKGPISFKKAAKLNQVIGRAVKWGRSDLSIEDEALKSLWVDLANTLDNPEVLGEAATRYQPLKSAYREALEAGGKVRGASKLFRSASNVVDDEAAFLPRLGNVVKRLEDVHGAQLNLGGDVKLAKMSPEDASVISTTLGDMRKLYDIKVASRASKARKVLQVMAKRGPDALDEDVARVAKLMDAKQQANAVSESVRNLKVADVIKRAVDDPFSPKKAKDAEKYLEGYVGAGKAELRALLNKSARYARLSSVKDKEMFNIVKAVRENKLMPPEELLQLEVAADVSPEIVKLFKDADIAEAIVKENPQLVTGTSITLAGASATGLLAGHPASLAFAAIPFMWRTFKNPTALSLLLQKAGKAGLYSDKQLLKIAQAAKFAGRATAILNNTNKEEDR